MSSAIIDLRPRVMFNKLTGRSINNRILTIGVIAGSAIIGYVTFKMNYNNEVVATVGNFGNLDKAGNNILDVLRHIGYWVVLGTGLMNVIKSALAGDTHAIFKIIMTSVLLYASLFFLPYALRLVEGIF